MGKSPAFTYSLKRDLSIGSHQTLLKGNKEVVNGKTINNGMCKAKSPLIMWVNQSGMRLHSSLVVDFSLKVTQFGVSSSNKGKGETVPCQVKRIFYLFLTM